VERKTAVSGGTSNNDYLDFCHRALVSALDELAQRFARLPPLPYATGTHDDERLADSSTRTAPLSELGYTAVTLKGKWR
jgi:hypothetical protein